MKYCVECGTLFYEKHSNEKTCSPKCRRERRLRVLSESYKKRISEKDTPMKKKKTYRESLREAAEKYAAVKKEKLGLLISTRRMDMI